MEMKNKRLYQRYCGILSKLKKAYYQNKKTFVYKFAQCTWVANSNTIYVIVCHENNNRFYIYDLNGNIITKRENMTKKSLNI